MVVCKPILCSVELNNCVIVNFVKLEQKNLNFSEISPLFFLGGGGFLISYGKIFPYPFLTKKYVFTKILFLKILF